MSLREIEFAHHRIINPFTDEQLLLLGRVARIATGTTILDLACGKGEMLCRFAREYGAVGRGVDINPTFVAAARQRATDLDVTSKVDFVVADASTYAGSQPYEIVSCLGAVGVMGGSLFTGIGRMRTWLADGGLLLVGEPYWIDAEPDDIHELSGFVEPGSVATLPGMLDRFDAAGVELVEMVLADPAGWDRYEAGRWWALTEWLRDHPDDDRAPTVRAARESSRRHHLTWGRRCMGWGVFVLQPA